MQTQYRSVSCPRCSNVLRLTVRNEERLGKPVKLTCMNCWEEFETILPVLETPPSTVADQPDIDKMTEKDVAIIGPLAEEFGNALREVVETSPELGRIVEKLRAAGYDPILMIAATMGLSKQKGSRVREPVPLVKNGEVIPEAFNVGDGAWLKDFHINL